MSPRRLLIPALLALLAVTTITPRTQTLAAGGRKFPHCITACVAVSDFCVERCHAECTAFYAGDPGLIATCVAACRVVCTGVAAECRFVCLSELDHPGGGPIEP